MRKIKEFQFYFWGLAIVVSICGSAIHPFLGFLALVGMFVIWFVRRQRRFLRDWAPNINGENAYAILGVAQNAGVPAIRRAFRRLVLRFHPDGVPAAERENATATFIRLSQAFELLADEEKRFQYDGWIDDLDGNVPPFAEAYELLKEEGNYPIYEIYDALYNPRKMLPDIDSENLEDNDDSSWTAAAVPIVTDPARNPLPERPAAVPDAESRAQTQQPATERPDDPMDVDIPDAVREALGMPVRRREGLSEPYESLHKSGPTSGGQPQTPCLRCGVPCPSLPEGGHALCAKCSGSAGDNTSD